MTCMKCNRTLARCICADADERIAELRSSPYLLIDWDRIVAERHLNKFAIERDRAVANAEARP